MKRGLVSLLLIALVAGAGLAFWIYRDLHTAVSHTKDGQYIDIPRGSSPTFVVKKLAAEGIIRHEWPLMAYLKISGSGSQFKSGEYNFRSPITPLAVVARLRQGEQRLIRLTIVEGWTRWDIANAMFR